MLKRHCVDDGVAKFFEMPRKQCKAALDIYKKFVANMEVVAKFLAVAEVSLLALQLFLLSFFLSFFLCLFVCFLLSFIHAFIHSFIHSFFFSYLLQFLRCQTVVLYKMQLRLKT